MNLLVVSLIILVAGSIGALAAGRARPALASALGCGSVLLAAVVAAFPVAYALAGVHLPPLRAPWPVPMDEFYLHLDSLAAIFLLPILLVSALAAVYGRGYLGHYATTKNLGAAWFFYGMLVGSMMLVVLARNAMLFLVAWEIMSLASYFLVTFESEKPAVREAGWTYLVATHMGTAFLLVMFMLLGARAGSMSFDNFPAAASAVGPGLCFALAVIGFGTKAGFMPLHVWLPQAHPAAPSHVSAVMSGVMIKTGLYGLCRMLTLLGEVQPWQGYLLLGVGAVSGVMGVLLALAQSDLKRLLAYSSVENIGIIAMALGMGLLGQAHRNTPLAVLGYAAALLHVLNHSLFKTLLFMGAGAVLHGAGTARLEMLGGLLKRMRITGLTFVIASVAICALPPLNGFVSEWLLYLSAFGGISGFTVHSAGLAVAGVVVVGCLALIGGLSAAAFAKAAGTGFLGEPRTPAAAGVHEAPAAMRVPMLILAALCVLVGLGSPLVVMVVAAPVAALMQSDVNRLAMDLHGLQRGLVSITVGAGALVVLIALLALARHALLRRREVGHTGTWDCGYIAPTARMQYTASSFAWPLARTFSQLLGTRTHVQPPDGLLPTSGHLESTSEDLFLRRVHVPSFTAAAWLLGKLRVLQQGRLQMYVLYIALTLLVLLVWKLS